MKKAWKILAGAMLLGVLLLHTSAMQNVYAAESTQTEQQTDVTTVTGLQTVDGKKYFYDSNGEIVKNVFKTINGKKYYFGSDGAAVTGQKKTISGKVYYFNSAGACYTGWKTISGKIWYFTESGSSMGARVTGWKTIGTKRYYLYKTGGRAVGWTKISGKTYYFSEKGVLKVGKTNKVSAKATKLNGLIINKKGVCTTDGKKATNVMITLNKQIAKDLKAAKLTSSMSDKKKVNALFKYLCSKCSYQHLAINPYATTFSTSSALRMLQKGRGNCYCYGAAFAYLVKAATGYETRVSYGSCTIRRGWGRGTYSHGWTEVKIGGKWKIFDVELYDRGSFSSRYSTGKTYSAMSSAGTSYHRSGYVNITL